MEHNKGFAPIAIVLIIVAVLVLGGFVYYATKDSNSKKITVSTTLPTPYISAQSGWPPVINLVLIPYVCREGSHSEMEHTIEKVINGKTYCVSITTEGAAGHSYRTYTYFGNSRITHFTLNYENCGVYSEPQYTECQNAQSNFNLDAIVGSLMELPQ